MLRYGHSERKKEKKKKAIVCRPKASAGKKLLKHRIRAAGIKKVFDNLPLNPVAEAARDIDVLTEIPSRPIHIRTHPIRLLDPDGIY